MPFSHQLMRRENGDVLAVDCMLVLACWKHERDKSGGQRPKTLNSGFAFAPAAKTGFTVFQEAGYGKEDNGMFIYS